MKNIITYSFLLTFASFCHASFYQKQEFSANAVPAATAMINNTADAAQDADASAMREYTVSERIAYLAKNFGRFKTAIAEANATNIYSDPHAMLFADYTIPITNAPTEEAIARTARNTNTIN